MEKNLKKALGTALLILLAVVSIFVIARFASRPESYESTVLSVDDKIDTVLKLTASSTLLSAGVSAIPDDTATPIAEKLADFTEYFLLVLCVLYAEKFLLTIIGTAAFKILVPIACLFFIVALYRENESWQRVGAKTLLFALAVYFIIPLSLRVSDKIYNNYQETLDITISSAEDFTETTSEISESDGDETVISRILERISETATTLANKAAVLMNRFVQALAVLIVTSCIMPLLVLAFFAWLIKLFAGADITVNLPHAGGRGRRGGVV